MNVLGEKLDHPHGIVVGFDGSGPSGHAVDWAAGEAARRGVPLTVASAIEFSGLISRPGQTTPWLSRSAASAVNETARLGAVRAQKAAPRLEVRVATRTAGPASMLVELSWWADLVVVGTRGHGEVAAAVLGSVAFAVAAHARCPVAVVSGAGYVLAGVEHPILVGVDGSAEAQAALHYAADLAAGLSSPLTVTTVWRSSAADAWAMTYGGVDAEVVEAAGETAAKVNAAAVDEARLRHPTLDVRPQVVVGIPGRAIADLGRANALIVVGSRGRGGFGGLLLGSVSHAVIRQAVCPVIVVRPLVEPGRSTGPDSGPPALKPAAGDEPRAST
jgi:nucleotide-binding universal stress UspA family protein